MVLGSGHRFPGGKFGAQIGAAVQNILHREQIRDGKLANRLKIINNKQAARIREIETQELTKQQEELRKLVSGDDLE